MLDFVPFSSFFNSSIKHDFDVQCLIVFSLSLSFPFLVVFIDLLLLIFFFIALVFAVGLLLVCCCRCCRRRSVALFLLSLLLLLLHLCSSSPPHLAFVSLSLAFPSHRFVLLLTLTLVLLPSHRFSIVFLFCLVS